MIDKILLKFEMNYIAGHVLLVLDEDVCCYIIYIYYSVILLQKLFVYVF